MTAARPQVVAVCGPTASGKSEVADLLAQALGSEVVSADAMQVYRGMDIGTAKEPEGSRRVPLRLVDVTDPDRDYSAALYQRDARAVADGLIARGRMPVFCGGTGLYLKAALDEMDFPTGERGGAVRVRLQADLERLGPEKLYERLRAADPASAALIHPHNARRVVRALEMLAEGRSYAEQQGTWTEPRPHYEALWVLPDRPREELYRRIDARVDLMLAQGLVGEVRGLLASGLNPEGTAMQAIGYKEVADHLAGRCSLDEAVALVKRNTRRLAKRQLSWFRRDGRIWWLPASGRSAQEVADEVLRRIGLSSACEKERR